VSKFTVYFLNAPYKSSDLSLYKYRNDAYWVKGTRISLDSIAYAFQQGLSPESIVQSFPLLTLEQVYGAIGFYLANRAGIDAYVRRVCFNRARPDVGGMSPSGERWKWGTMGNGGLWCGRSGYVTEY